MLLLPSQITASALPTLAQASSLALSPSPLRSSFHWEYWEQGFHAALAAVRGSCGVASLPPRGALMPAAAERCRCRPLFPPHEAPMFSAQQRAAPHREREFMAPLFSAIKMREPLYGSVCWRGICQRFEICCAPGVPQQRARRESMLFATEDLQVIRRLHARGRSCRIT